MREGWKDEGLTCEVLPRYVHPLVLGREVSEAHIILQKWSTNSITKKNSYFDLKERRANG